MSKIYIVKSGNPFAKVGERVKYFSTEEKARRFIEEDCERVRNKYKFEGEPQWDEDEGCFLHHYGCDVIKYYYCEEEVL